jgi:hypothetical protein
MTNPFNFFESLNGRELFHWSGIPCFISSYYDFKNSNMVQIVTYDGKVYDDIPETDLESMSPEDMNFA